MKITKKIKHYKFKEQSGYPAYPESEDIYSKDIETNIDPEKIEEMPIKAEAGKEDELLKKRKTLTTSELDVPGDELDDEKETAGSEDEGND